MNHAQTLTTAAAVALVLGFSQAALASEFTDRLPQHTGVGAGAVIGALLGGPVGAVAGATFGNFIGVDRIKADQLSASESALTQTARELAIANEALAQQRGLVAELKAEAGAKGAQVLALRTLVTDMPVAVRFETNSATIADTYAPTLDALAKAGKAIDGFNVAVVGHADPSGSDNTNQALSETRAAVVASDLIERGMAGESVTWIGLGETVPSGHAQHDRRAELRLSFEVPVNEGLHSAQQ